ncbi:MAG TPA: hypothetical protein PLZ67_02135 [Bacteroidales bacterium]|nr:hypothetical protein [Bacteroidales bacterium]
MLLDKYNALKTAYKFDYIGAKAILQNSSIQTKDTLKAMSFLFAAGLVSESDVTTSIVYQIIPESYYHGLYNPDSDSLWTYDNFFSNKLPIDSGEYKNEEFYINYIPKKPGKYYLRGYFNVPSIGYKNKLYISKYPFQSVFEAH